MAGLKAAVRRDLRVMDAAAPGIAKSAEALLAVNLAGWMEDPETPGMARASMAGRLEAVLAGLRERLPAGMESPLDRIRREQAVGIARLPAAEAGARPRRRRAS